MSDLTWTPVRVKLGQIQPWTDNPRMSTKAQAQRLIKSERRLGQIQTLAIGPMIDGKYPLYDGHQRVSSWLTVKTPDFEVMALQSNRPLTDDERREVAVLLHTATGSWDWNALSGWSAADLREWGMDGDTLKGWNNDALNLREMIGVEEIEHSGDDKSGASPWERMSGSGDDGVLFVFGDITVKVDKETYALFSEKCPPGDILEYVVGVIEKGCAP